MELRATLLAAVRHILVPIARMLVRNGVGFGDFVEAARYAFVEAGEAVLKERGLASTPARMSVMTGQTRRDVERIVDDPLRYAITTSPDWRAATYVLHAWHTKPPFVLIPVGMPMELDYDLPGSKLTFVALVRSVVQDVEPARVLEILQEIAAIEKDEHGRYRPLTRYLIPARHTAHQFRLIARSARRLLDTIDVNLSRDREQGRFERHVCADRGVPVRRYDDFVSFARKTTARALEDIDDWIADNAAVQPDEPVLWPGIGIYHWVDDAGDPQFPLDYALSEIDVTEN
ncbi:MAG: DUF6502 family protein [Steroidobacteraceae bacterium]